MESELKNIINLIKKTGDKCIVTDIKGTSPYVIMGLKEYERLVLGKSEVKDLTEEEFLDKINRDIAHWKATQEYQENGASLEEVVGEDGVINNLMKKKDVKGESKAATVENNSEEKYYVESAE